MNVAPSTRMARPTAADAIASQKGHALRSFRWSKLTHTPSPAIVNHTAQLAVIASPSTTTTYRWTRPRHEETGGPIQPAMLTSVNGRRNGHHPNPRGPDGGGGRPW